MEQVSHNHEQAGIGQTVSTKDWRRSISNHVAFALLTYTGLQILVTIKALAEGSSSILPYAALIILVAAIIPGCRWFERRWSNLDDEQARDPALARDFRRDTIWLWALALGLPIILTGLIKGLFALFAIV